MTENLTPIGPSIDGSPRRRSGNEYGHLARDADGVVVWVTELTDPELVPLPAGDEFAEFDTTGAEFNAMWNQSSAQNIAINLTPAQQHADEQSAGNDRTRPPYVSGATLIADERRRQIDVEGWTQQHDASHGGPWLAFAAIAYATPEDERDYATYDTLTGQYRIPLSWPWGPDSWKPTPDDRVRELVKAGALIAAEIDRLLDEEA